jgi:hypothetical protein
MDAEARRRLLREALGARLAEVRALIPYAPGVAPPPAPAADPEDVLRVVMVRLWPAADAGSAGPGERAHVAAALLGLAEVARGEDLRFLDAWNNVYETARQRRWPEPELAGLLPPYAAALEAHLARL